MLSVIRHEQTPDTGKLMELEYWNTGLLIDNLYTSTNMCGNKKDKQTNYKFISQKSVDNLGRKNIFADQFFFHANGCIYKT